MSHHGTWPTLGLYVVCLVGFQVSFFYTLCRRSIDERLLDLMSLALGVFFTEYPEISMPPICHSIILTLAPDPRSVRLSGLPHQSAVSTVYTFLPDPHTLRCAYRNIRNTVTELSSVPGYRSTMVGTFHEPKKTTRMMNCLPVPDHPDGGGKDSNVRHIGDSLA